MNAKRPMPRAKPSAKERGRLEYERFLETAKELGADRESPETERILRRTVTPSRARRKG